MTTPAPAIFRRPGGNSPALGAHALFPELVVALDGDRRFGGGDVAAALQRGGEVLRQPGLGLGAEGVEIGAAKISHGRIP